MVRRSQVRLFAVALVALLSLLPVATAFAAAPSQDVNTDLVGLWVSEESTEGETVALSLFDDGSMQAQSDFADGSDSVIYNGSWGDNGDETVSVFIEAVDGMSFGEDAVEIAFDVVSETELNAPDTTDFGDDGMTIMFEDAEPIAFADEAGIVVEDAATASDDVTDTEEVVAEAVPGAYVTDELDSEGVPVAALVYLGEDGTVQSIAATFDGETLPVTRVGTWVDNGDGTLTITSVQSLDATEDGAELNDLDEEEPLDFTISGDTLSNEVLTLYRLGAVTEQFGGFAGMLEEDLSAEEDAGVADSTDMALYMSPMKEILAGTINVLVLQADGIASFTAGTTDQEEPAVVTGMWSEDEDGLITVELTMDDAGEELAEPSTIVFEMDEDGNLVATDFDTDLYGDSIVLELSSGQ